MTRPGPEGTSREVLDLPRLKRIHLSSRPRAQRIVGWSVLVPNYELPPRVRIELEGELPSEPVIFAMNHTDRYNYWPFQYRLWRDHDRFTATWVKGKYYENAFVGKFMELTNNIPTVSRGYLITRDFLSTVGRRPSDGEYAILRRAVDAAAEGRPSPDPIESRVPEPLLRTGRDMLGRHFDPERESYPEAVEALFRQMMERFVELNAEAFDKGLDLLVFPQGTRSIRLLRGHGGIAQIALRFRRTIVPVGCNGCDRVYPAASPIARAGHVLYRVGRPIRYEEMASFHIHEPFEPFTAEAERTYRDRFQGLTDYVMDRVNDLLDARYQYGDGGEVEGSRGTNRFV